MKHTKIVDVQATIVTFWFWKQVRICETIFIKMTHVSMKWVTEQEPIMIPYFENDDFETILFK